MEQNSTYQYDLVKRLSFVRFGGTDEELRAANILLGEIESAGGKGEVMDFSIPAYDLKKCSAKVTSPFEKELEVVPYGLSAQLPEGGVELKLMYAERGTADDYFGVSDLSDTAVILNELNYDAYKLLAEKHAAAFIVISGKYYETSESSDLVPRILRPKMQELGNIPGFCMWAGEATDIIRDGAEKIHLELRFDTKENTSRDVLAVIEGTEITDESIVITAHYDSVLVGTGSWDNATGAATIMYIYKHFLKNPPRRTLRFVWCGSEEQGLYGSKAYIEQHEDLVAKEIKFCFNFDMCGTVLGENSICVTGGDDLLHLAQQFCHELGYSAKIEARVHSSDSAPFADKGIPALGLSRGTKTSEIHTRHDLMFPIGAKQLKQNGDFAINFISRVANSAILPVPTGMPDNMRESLDKYFQRDKKPSEN
jgi:hypothetical protein